MCAGVIDSAPLINAKMVAGERGVGGGRVGEGAHVAWRFKSTDICAF